MSATPANLNHWPLSNESADVLPTASLAVSPGDLMYYDATNHNAKPFSSLTPGASEAADQATIAPLFLGVSNTQRRSDDASISTALRIIVDEIWEFPCVSGTFEVGDLVAPTRDGGAALVDQKVTKTATAANSIGIVVKAYTLATTKVKVRLCGKRLGCVYL